MILHVNTGSPLPIYQQLVHQLREAIARGTLQPEERLPSVRQLAEQLNVNPNTLARAYKEMEIEGLLVSRPGLGVFVAEPRNDLTKTARDRRLIEGLDRWLTEAVHLGCSADEVMRLVSQRAAQFQWNANGSRSKDKG
jgi:GntR family transcriptional regulator